MSSPNPSPVVALRAVVLVAMLKFAGAPYRVPDNVYVHGFLTALGEKMSKSRGTGISPDVYLDLGLYPEWLGDRSFCEVHGVRFPYVVGEMANGLTTIRMVVEAARDCLSGFERGALSQLVLASSTLPLWPLRASTSSFKAVLPTLMHFKKASSVPPQRPPKRLKTS